MIGAIRDWWHRRQQGHEPVWIEGAFDQIGWDRFCDVCVDERVRTYTVIAGDSDDSQLGTPLT